MQYFYALVFDLVYLGDFTEMYLCIILCISCTELSNNQCFGLAKDL